jgi:AraC-like DNA-binding protein
VTHGRPYGNGERRPTVSERTFIRPSGVESVYPEQPRRIRVDTTDPDEAHDYLRATYVDHAVRLDGSIERFRFRHQLTDGGRFFVARYEHSMNCEVNTEPFGYLLMGQVFHGRLRMSTWRDELSPGHGEPFVLDPAAPMCIRWEDFRAGLVKLDLGVVDRVAEEITGGLAGPVRFSLARAVSPARAANWQALVRYISREFCHNEAAYGSPLIHAQTMRLLAATALETFPNVTMDADRGPSGDIGAPGAVRRATAFIDDHAGEPIGLAEIAEAARLSPRAVQDAFRRHLDTTPTTYLRRVRLRRAQHELRAADPGGGTTVAEVATRWGFAHHGRFAASYRREFGCTPTQDLYA